MNIEILLNYFKVLLRLSRIAFTCYNILIKYKKLRLWSNNLGGCTMNCSSGFSSMFLSEARETFQVSSLEKMQAVHNTVFACGRYRTRVC